MPTAFREGPYWFLRNSGNSSGWLRSAALLMGKWDEYFSIAD